jgi:hypothetical protein
MRNPRKKTREFSDRLLQQGDNSMEIFGYSKWRPLYRFNISNPNNFQGFVDFMLKFYQLALLTWIKHRVVKKNWKKSAMNVQNRPRLQVGVSA